MNGERDNSFLVRTMYRYCSVSCYFWIQLQHLRVDIRFIYFYRVFIHFFFMRFCALCRSKVCSSPSQVCLLVSNFAKTNSKDFHNERMGQKWDNHDDFWLHLKGRTWCFLVKVIIVKYWKASPMLFPPPFFLLNLPTQVTNLLTLEASLIL